MREPENADIVLFRIRSVLNLSGLEAGAIPNDDETMAN